MLKRRLPRRVLMLAQSGYISTGSAKRRRRAEVETEVKRKPQAYLTEEEVRAIQAKDWLTLKEAALLLNVSPLTLRRWVLSGKVKSKKLGKKHLFERKIIKTL